MTEREIFDKLRIIEEKVDRIEKSYLKKRGLPWKAGVPSLIVCKDIVTAFDGKEFDHFDYMMQRLAEFYGIRRMDNRTNPEKVPKTAIACYHSSDKTAYYAKPTCSITTVLHEFFHHLHHEGVVTLYSDEDTEKCANEFANIVIARGRMP